MPNCLHQRILRRLLSPYDTPLMGNSYRGAYIEVLIAEALGSDWSLSGNDWGPWDLQHRNGARLEVKQSAALQPWASSGALRRIRKPTFDISFKRGFWRDVNDWAPIAAPARLADLYVFAWHPVIDPALADHRNPAQWQFYVVEERRLHPRRKTITLNPLRKRTVAIPYVSLAKAVTRITLNLHGLKRDTLS